MTAPSGQLSRLDHGGLAAAICASSPLAVIVLELDGTIHDVNPAAAALLEAGPQELAGTAFGDLAASEQREFVAGQLELARNGPIDHLEVDVRLPSGRLLPVGISFAPLMVDGVARGLVGVGRDITDRRLLAHEMRETARSFLALAEGTDLGIYRFSFRPQMRVDYVNPAFAAVVGASLPELREQPEILSEGLPPETLALLNRSRRRGVTVTWPLETRWRRPDGTEIVISLRESHVRDVDGRLEAVLGIVRDVTADRRHAQTLAAAAQQEREAAARLRRVDELRRLFLQAVSHELRTPLTSVLGITDTLRRLDLDDRVLLLLDRQQQAGERLKTLLDDLLDVERLSRGVITLDKAPVDLRALVEGFVRDRGDDHVTLALQPATVMGDRSKLERILDNLVQNARRHAGPEAQVDIRIRRVDGSVHLEVDDDGPGVAEDQREAIFEAFVQGQTTAKLAQPGTGIGLTLVAELTRLHGGRCWVEDGERGGARFVVGLPAADE